MKLFIAVFGIAVLAAANGKRFELGDCILMDVDANLTVTAQSGSTKLSIPLDLSELLFNVSGSCQDGNATSISMTMSFQKTLKWNLVFTTTHDDRVQLSQLVSFEPATLFGNKTLPAAQASLADKEMSLSLKNESFVCNTEQSTSFKPYTKDNYTFGVSQVLSNLKVQAFGLKNKTYSPAEHCAEDQTETTESSSVPPTKVTTVTISTEMPTPEPMPDPGLVKAAEFNFTDDKGIVCFSLVAGLQFVVEYNTTNNNLTFSKPITISGSANVTGKCANGTNSATMNIISSDSELTIVETRTKDKASSAITLRVRLDPTNFPGAAKANESVTFEMAHGSFEQESVTTFYHCKTQQNLTFNASRTTLFTNDVRLQAFNLKNGSFTGEGAECSLDPRTTPTPPVTTPVPGDNTYVVQEGNITCIVWKGDIAFSNFSYSTTDNGSATVNGINIPAMNQSAKDVSGNCSMLGGKAQELKITFNTNWTLTLTFVLGADSVSSMLGASKKEYSLHGIELLYYLSPEFFPNASNPNAKMTVKNENISGDFLVGSMDGGSYKCNDKLTTTIERGVQFETWNLQYKAFNNDNTTTFSGNVSECPGDTTSNSIVPIAVGAALAGLVVIVLIAYLIGRRRSRRKGYESV